MFKSFFHCLQEWKTDTEEFINQSTLPKTILKVISIRIRN